MKSVRTGSGGTMPGASGGAGTCANDMDAAAARIGASSKLRVIRLLGTGGMGAVYEVEHEFTKHRRAMKLLHGPMARMPSVVTRKRKTPFSATQTP